LVFGIAKSMIDEEEIAIVVAVRSSEWHRMVAGCG
jgi:hypothetical protein